MYGSLIFNLLMINVIVALVYESGFWDNLDEYINNKFKFYHIPHILTCGLCQTWWLSLLYIIMTGNLNLMMIAICLFNAHLNKVVIALYKLIENLLLKLIGLLNNLIGY